MYRKGIHIKIALGALLLVVATLTWKTAYAGPITGGAGNAPYTKLGVYQGLISVVPGGTTDSILEIGNAGRDIASTGDIYLRPGSLSTAAADFARIYEAGGKAALTIPGAVTGGYFYATPQNTVDEGGQLSLLGAAAYTGWNVDSYQNRLRFFNGPERVAIDANGNVNLWTGSLCFGGGLSDCHNTWTDVLGGGGTQHWVDDGATSDTATYASIGITRSAAAVNNSYIGLTKAGIRAWGIGLSGAGSDFIFGPASSSKTIPTPYLTIGSNGGNVSIGTPGASQGEKSTYTWYSTFQATGDNGPRRTADISAGFNGGAWGNEYLAFGVGYGGASNDPGNPTLEKIRILSNGNVGIGTTTPRGALDLRADESTRVYIANNEPGDTNQNSPKLSFWGGGQGGEIIGPSLQKINIGPYGAGRLAFFQHDYVPPNNNYTNETEVVSIWPSGDVNLNTGRLCFGNGTGDCRNTWVGLGGGSSQSLNDVLGVGNTSSRSASLGSGTTPTAKLLVHNTESGAIPGPNAGSAGDSIAAYANSVNSSIYAQQLGSGYAGYFSGPFAAIQNGASDPAGGWPVNSILRVASNSDNWGEGGFALDVVNNDPTGYAARFDGAVHISGPSGNGLGLPYNQRGILTVTTELPSGVGIYSEVTAGSTGGQAIHGKASNANTWAGYFDGNVTVTGALVVSQLNQADGAPTGTLVGTGALPVGGLNSTPVKCSPGKFVIGIKTLSVSCSGGLGCVQIVPICSN